MDRTKRAAPLSEAERDFKEFLSRHKFSSESKTTVSSYLDPTARIRAKFINGVKQMLLEIEAEISGKPLERTPPKRRLVWWFWSHEDNTWKTELRYGSTCIQVIPGKKSIACRDFPHIAEIYKEVIRLADKGSFDEQLAVASGKRGRKVGGTNSKA